MGIQGSRVTRLALFALGVAAVGPALFTPAAVARPPSCAISNDNHKGYDALQDAVDAAKAG